MIIYHDPDAWVPVSETTTCEYHRLHPGKPWPGCMCSASFGSRRATPEEYRERRARRLAERREELELELRLIALEEASTAGGK